MSIQYLITAGEAEDRRDVGIMANMFGQISEAFKPESCLLPVKADHLEASFLEGLAVVAVDLGGQVVGYTRLQPLLTKLSPEGEWFELGGTWVHPDFRGRKINETMYELLLPKHRSKNILATTTNQISFEVGKRLGFVLVPRKNLPQTVWQASCICPISKTGSITKDNETCTFAWGESQCSNGPCWFRVTAETAQRLDL